MMKISKQWLVDNCSRYNASCETPIHILTCKSAGSTSLWKRSIKELREWLVDKNTCLDIASFIIQAMYQWRKGEKVTPLKDYNFDEFLIVYC